jgi:hypothetical protein
MALTERTTQGPDRRRHVRRSADRPQAASSCEHCGQPADPGIRVFSRGQIHAFDRVDCAVSRLAEICQFCEECHAVLLDEGVTFAGASYCSMDCVPDEKLSASG